MLSVITTSRKVTSS